jgi:hypothetical protein
MLKDFLDWDVGQREILHEFESYSNHIISSFTLLSNYFYILVKSLCSLSANHWFGSCGLFHGLLSLRDILHVWNIVYLHPPEA